MEILNKIITPGMILVLTIVSGFWLSHTAKPLNTAIFTIHKLIALAAVIFTVIQLRNQLLSMTVQSGIILFLVLGGLSVLTLFASGALMSIGKLDFNLMHTIHRVGTGLLVISLAAVVYSLNVLKAVSS
jgi:branched-subunit amino acid transport protein AzlD